MKAPNNDIFSFLIFLGVVQGFFLAAFFLSGQRKKQLSNLFLGLMLLSLSAIILEIFLCYTNYMFGILHIIDFSEPLNYALGPLYYCYIVSKTRNEFDYRNLWHFAIFIAYFIYSLSWQFQSLDFKYNSYISAYHPEIPYKKVELWAPYYPLFRYHTDIQTFLHLSLYLFFSQIQIARAFREKQIPFFSSLNPNLKWLRNIQFQVMMVAFILIIVKVIFYNDLGDYLIASHISFVIYIVSIVVVKNSLFFHPAEPNKKYEKSSLNEEGEKEILIKLEALMQNEKIFAEADLSLPVLAKKIKVTPHHLSQVLNNRLNKSFFEYLAILRVEEAKRLLQLSENRSLKIDEIADLVGYNSKSAFNTAFRKHTGQTPSEFKKAQMASK